MESQIGEVLDRGDNVGVPRLDGPILELLQVRCFHNLGLAYQQAGHFADAITIHATCLNLAQRDDDAEGKMRAYHNLKRLHHYLGNEQAAREIIQSELELCKTLGMTYLPSTKAYMCGSYSLGIIFHKDHNAEE